MDTKRMGVFLTEDELNQYRKSTDDFHELSDSFDDLQLHLSLMNILADHPELVSLVAPGIRSRVDGTDYDFSDLIQTGLSMATEIEKRMTEREAFFDALTKKYNLPPQQAVNGHCQWHPDHETGEIVLHVFSDNQENPLLN